MPNRRITRSEGSLTTAVNDTTSGRSAAANLDRPQPPSLDRDQALDVARELIALRARERGREVAHDLRIAVQRGERRQVLLAPLAQQQAWRRELGHAGNRMLRR